VKILWVGAAAARRPRNAARIKALEKENEALKKRIKQLEDELRKLKK